MYAGVGVGYNVRTHGMAVAPGSHPHFLLWTQFAGLVVDGALFFRARVLSRGTGVAVGGYETLPDEAAMRPDSSEHEALPE